MKLNGQVDAIVLAGGIGEKSALLRQTLADKLQCLGVAIDAAANDKGPGDGETVKDISAGGGKGPRVLVCQANEQVSVSQSRRLMIQSVWREVEPFWRVYARVLIRGWILANMGLYCSSRWHTAAFARGAEFIICEVSSIVRAVCISNGTDRREWLGSWTWTYLYRRLRLIINIDGPVRTCTCTPYILEST